MKYIKIFSDYQFIVEKLTDVDDDVDLIYDLFFKKDIEEIEKTGIITKSMFKYSESNTSILKSTESINGHQIAPCTIIINKQLNGYDPINKIIYISVNLNAVDIALEDSGDIGKAASWMENKTSFLREFTKEKIKGSIHHELVHWLDDTFHSGHIRKRIERQLGAGTRNLGGKSVNSEKFEIQAQIHNIKQLYNSFRDTWDSMSFTQMISLSPPLSNICRSLRGDELKKWRRDLKTRMAREGLLGKQMRD
jgi:hypothetical protein